MLLRFLYLCILILTFFVFSNGNSALAQKRFMDSLSQVIQVSEDPSAVCDAHVKIAELMLNNDIQFSELHADSSMTIARLNKLPARVAYAYNIKGVIELIKADFTRSHIYLDSAILIFKAVNNQHGAAVAYANRGNYFQFTGDLSRSLEDYLVALECYKKTGAEIGIARTQSNIGGIYHILGDSKSALSYYSQANQFWKKKNAGFIEQVGLLTNMADIYLRLGLADTAYVITEKMMKIADSIEMPAAVAEAWLSFGRINFYLGKPEVAVENYEKSIELQTKVGASHRVLLAKLELGAKLGEFGFYDQSTKQLLLIIDELRASGTPRLERDLYSQLSKNYAAKKNYERAYFYQNKFLEIDKQIIEADHLNRVSELEIKYESELKAEQISLLKEKNKSNALDIIAKDRELDLNKARDRERNFLVLGLIIFLALVIVFSFMFVRQKRLRQEKNIIELQHRALRAQMNPHFIFNAINSIQSYILNKNQHEAYDYLAKFGRLIRIVLHNSQEKSLMLHQELEMIKLYVEMEQLRFNNKFEFNLSINDDVHEYEMSVPAMLIQPYIENAIWHGLMNLENERNGILNLTLSMNDTLLKIIVEDNGIGREKSKLYKKEDSHKSVGMQLTEERLLMINRMEEFENAKVIITDLKDEKGVACGTRVEIFIPVNV